MIPADSPVDPMKVKLQRKAVTHAGSVLMTPIWCCANLNGAGRSWSTCLALGGRTGCTFNTKYALDPFLSSFKSIQPQILPSIVSGFLSSPNIPRGNYPMVLKAVQKHGPNLIKISLVDCKAFLAQTVLKDDFEILEVDEFVLALSLVPYSSKASWIILCRQAIWPGGPFCL